MILNLPGVAVDHHLDAEGFLRQVCLKAGLPKDGWKQGAEFYTFRSVHFRESRAR